MTITQIIGLIVVLGLAIFCGFLIVKNSKKNDLVKWLLLFIFVAIAFTWIFECGTYQNTEYYSIGMNQLGLTNIPYLFYNAIQFTTDKICFLLALGAFYGVLSKCESYKKLVSNLASKLKGKEIITVLVTSLLFTVLASILNQTFIALTFVPFVISVLLAMKLDKLTAFSATFGSILLGLIGATYGGESVLFFNQFLGTAVTTAILYRLIVLVVGFILYNFFTILHVKKVIKDKKVNDLEDDPFKVEKVDKKVKSWPVVVMLVILFVFLTLSYISWEDNFGITIFNSFHTWLTELHIGDVYPFQLILGSFAGAFGTYTDLVLNSTGLFNAVAVILVITILISLISRVKFNDFITGVGEGCKKMILPVALFVGSYFLMSITYSNPYVPAINNMMFKNITTFNPFLTSLSAIISNVFSQYFALVAITVGQFFVGTYASSVNIIHTIFTTMYGFTTMVLPTSGLLLIGLSYLNIEYKSWVKYIWIFAVAMLVILLVLFTVMTYI